MHPSNHRVHRPSSPVGYWWDRRTSVEWQRGMLRQCQDCNTLILEGVTWVDTDYEMCVNCFSQDLSLSERTNEFLHCSDCHIEFEATEWQALPPEEAREEWDPEC